MNNRLKAKIETHRQQLTGWAFEEGILKPGDRIEFRPLIVLSKGDILSRPAQDLKFRVRAQKMLRRLGIETIGQLIAKTADEILQAKNFSMTSLNEVRERLREQGLKLKGD